MSGKIELIFSHPAGECGRDRTHQKQPRKGWVFMRAPIPAADRTPPVSRVIAEALVRRQGPLRIVTRANRLGLSPVLTRAVIAACGASALDVDGLATRQRQVD